MLGTRFWLLSVGTTCAIVGVALGQFAIERHGWIAREGVILETTTTCEMREAKSRFIPTYTLKDEIDCAETEAYEKRFPNQQWLVLKRLDAQLEVSTGNATIVGRASLPTARYANPQTGDVVPVLQDPDDPTRLYEAGSAWVNWPGTILATMLAFICFYYAFRRSRKRLPKPTVPDVASPAPYREPVIQDVRRSRRLLSER